MAEEQRDFYEEAIAIVDAKSMMWPQHEHLRAVKAKLDEVRSNTLTIMGERDDARKELELERMRLAACSTAAIGNTPRARADRLAGDHPYFSASYGDVCAAVDREMGHREAERELRGALQRLIDAIDADAWARAAELAKSPALSESRALLANGPSSPAAAADPAEAPFGLNAIKHMAAAIESGEVDLAAVDAWIDTDMAALGSNLKRFVRQFIPKPAETPAAPAAATSPGEAAGLEMVVTIDRHGFRTDPWWVTFRLAELPTPGGGPMPVVEGGDEFCAGQFQTEESARAAVEAIRGIAIKDVIIRK